MVKTVGYIGIGNMGRPISTNVVNAGFELTVYDIREEPLQELAKLGAHIAASAREAPGAPQAGAQQVIVPEPLQRPREIRLPIFESVESDWFRARRRPPPRAGVPLDPHRAAPS